MSKADIFIADAHIKGMDSLQARAFIDFLDHIKGSTRTLYILGDLFDFWFGGNRVFLKRYMPIAKKLKELTDDSVKIVFLEGNHEISMGRYFTNTLKADVYEKDAELEVDGDNFYMTHGDLINYDDVAHIKWMKFMRGPIASLIMRLLPGWFFLYISKKISGASREFSKDKVISIDKHFDELVADMKGKGIETIVFAHTHSPLIKENGSGYIVNPGAFAANGSYARYENGTFTLKNFTQ